ncbi:MAG: amidohydrolase family protein [Myxococcales bacterium]|nr:amidohydrolase family protein [Myxococcales bacterium]
MGFGGIRQRWRGCYAAIGMLSAALLLFAPTARAAWIPGKGYVLRGTIVTMTAVDAVLVDHYLFVRNKKIEAISATFAGLPSDAQQPDVPLIETAGLIFPGMLNIHNHTAYNMLPLWRSPKDAQGSYYLNRYQWTQPKEYSQYVNYPKKILTDSNYLGLQVEVLKWAEIKALTGGETGIQGTPDLSAINQILVRNVESYNFGEDKVQQRGLSIDDTRWQAEVPSLIQKMDDDKVRAWLVHVAEGRWDDTSTVSISGVKHLIRDEYQRLKALGLARAETVIIHGAGLDKSELEEMGDRGMKLVWSPLSNILLYGVTTRIYLAMGRSDPQARVPISLATDWSPSGSKNLLDELKIADQVIKFFFPYQADYNDTWIAGDSGHAQYFNDFELVKMVTVNPAIALAWEDKVGTIEVGKYADLLVVKDTSATDWENDGNLLNDPIFATNPANQGKDFSVYRALINARPPDVLLTIVDGDPLYGEVALLKQLKPGDFELVCSVAGFTKAIDITKPNDLFSGKTIAKGDQTLAYVEQSLRAAMTFDSAMMKQRFKEAQLMDASEFDEFLKTKFRDGIPGYTAGLALLRLDPIFVTDDLTQTSIYNWFDLILDSQTITATYPSGLGVPDLNKAPDIEYGYYQNLTKVVSEGSISDGELASFLNSVDRDTLVNEVGLDSLSAEVDTIVNKTDFIADRADMLSYVTTCTLAAVENYLLGQKPAPGPVPDASDGTDADDATDMLDAGEPDQDQPDSTVDDPDVAKMLAFLNHETTTIDVLLIVPGLTSTVAANLIAHRDGPDGIFGTSDDNLFNDEAEVDSVDQVGAARIQALKDYAKSWTPSTPSNNTLLNFLNHITTTKHVLDDLVNLTPTQAENLIAHRDGPDGVPGTFDDNPFDSEAEVEGVKYVGLATIEKIRSWINANNWQPPPPADPDAKLVFFINHASTTFAVLYETVGISSRAATNIISHRDGADGKFGTSDDRLFLTVKELDDIPYVGTVTMQTLRDYVATWNAGTLPLVVLFVNGADASQLVTAITTCNPNISQTTAQKTADAIIARRDTLADQKFTGVEPIDEVSGVGPATLKALTDFAKYQPNCAP